MIKFKHLESPVFLLGHARGGTTALAASINWARDMGPKYPPMPAVDDLDGFVHALKDYQTHIKYSDQLEQKDIWFRYFPGREVFTHMGKEISIGADFLDEKTKAKLVNELTWALKQDRYFSKAPTNSFRIPFLKAISENPKFIAVVRDGREVISSWGRRPYGFNKKVCWGEVRTRKFAYKKAINIFGRKWNETLEAIMPFANDPTVLIIDYADMLNNWKETIGKVYDHLCLEVTQNVLNIKYLNKADKWREDIPSRYHQKLEAITATGNEWILDNKD